MIKEYPNFLSESECVSLIGLGESGALMKGMVVSKQNGIRKAKVRSFGGSDLVTKIKQQIATLSDTPLEKQEEFHFVRYDESDEYKEHFDGLSRCKTALIYLNDGFSGGETFFPKINHMIKPEIGKLVIWENILKDGSRNEDSMHCGLPVKFGTKYIAVIWIKK